MPDDTTTEPERVLEVSAADRIASYSRRLAAANEDACLQEAAFKAAIRERDQAIAERDQALQDLGLLADARPPVKTLKEAGQGPPDGDTGRQGQ